jgi:hypothetical protein
MLPRITITRTWSDNDVAQLTFEVCDGVSVFTNEAYASLEWGATAAAALRTFGSQIHGGLFDLEAGEGGTFNVPQPGRDLVPTREILAHHQSVPSIQALAVASTDTRKQESNPPCSIQRDLLC